MEKKKTKKKEKKRQRKISERKSDESYSQNISLLEITWALYLLL